ncbi:MAG: hypothetical protein HY318_20050 [Armatimonadetes bacterium]|nr:hypothetical protein [Armatimonadota bacterium]
MLCLGHDDKFYTFDVVTEKAALLAEARLPDGKGPRDIALGPKGDFYALAHDGSVHGWTRDGKPNGEILQAKPGKDWWYCSLGVDPKTGDFILGSYWPDNRIYRFNASGNLLAVQESDNGYAAMILPLDGHAWMVNVAGRAAKVTKSSTGRRVVAGDWAYYPTGLASETQGGAWIACAQGLLHFDRKGRPTGERLGGLADPSLLAAGPDGTLLALIENGQRIVRMYADDEMNAPFSSNANEPWRVGNGWTGRAVGLAWDGAGYLVLDATAKCLWRFDPDRTAWGERPWVRLTKEGAFQNPRALAVGDALAYVLDGESILAISLATPDAPSVAVPLALSVKPADIVALAADEDEQVYIATAKELIALDQEGRERWKTITSSGGITSLACDRQTLFVADRSSRSIVPLLAATGQDCGRLGMSRLGDVGEPNGVAAGGGWVFVADPTGHRLLRAKQGPCYPAIDMHP